jgi:hypothetical protein
MSTPSAAPLFDGFDLESGIDPGLGQGRVGDGGLVEQVVADGVVADAGGGDDHGEERRLLSCPHSGHATAVTGARATTRTDGPRPRTSSMTSDTVDPEEADTIDDRARS